VDVFKPPSVVCRGAVSVCDVEEACTGSEAQCPPDTTEPDGMMMESCPAAPGVHSFWCQAGQCEVRSCEAMKVDLDQSTYPNGCEADGHTVFVTSSQYAATLGGLDGADAICADLSSRADLPGRFVAILSTSAVNAAERFTSTAPIADTSGRLIANDDVDMWDATLVAPIELDEQRTLRNYQVWTGTAPNGQRDTITDFCADWTGTSGGVQVGLAGDATRSWVSLHTTLGRTGCTTNQALYCISVP
jgi:hypothetical protein